MNYRKNNIKLNKLIKNVKKLFKIKIKIIKEFIIRTLNIKNKLKNG